MNEPNNSSEQEETEQILKDVAVNGSFAEYCIAIDQNYKLEWFHEEVSRRLESGYKRLMAGEDVRIMFFMPPRHGKSDMTTQKFPSWVLGKHPDTSIMVSSYSDELATDFGQRTRDIMQTPDYQCMFNTRLRADAKAKGKWLTETGGGYTAVGVGGALTGRGFKIGIIDDPFKNREEADSPVIRESRYKWYQSTFSTREEGNSMVIFILTRWHDDDLAGRVLRENQLAMRSGEPHKNWEIIEYKAIATQDEEHRKEGEALWPDKFPLKKLLEKKSEMGPYEFSALYQQNPVDEENRKFKSEWIKYRDYFEVAKLNTFNVMTIDPRGKDDIKLGKDYIGVTINFVDGENNWNIISYREKLNAKQLLDLLFTNWEKYNLDRIGIEDNQFYQGLKYTIEDECRRRNVHIYIEELKTGGTQKELRIESLVPRYNNGTIYHITLNGQNLCLDLEEELATFPKSTNDDASDSLAYQTQIAMTPGGYSGDSVSPSPESAYPKNTPLALNGVGLSPELDALLNRGNEQEPEW